MSTYFSEGHLFSKIVPLLKAAPEPDGYRPLGIQREAISHLDLSFVQIIQEVNNQSTNSSFENQATEFFKRLGVKIVSDFNKNLNLNEITPSEAKSYYVLFKDIAEEKSPIKFQGDRKFNEQCLELIRQLLAKPSGRYLIHSICKSHLPIFLTPADASAVGYDQTFSHIEVLLNLEVSLLEVQIDQNGKRQYGICCPMIIFAHELIHVIQRHLLYCKSIKNKTKEQIQETKAVRKFFHDPAPYFLYSNLCEMFTISGIENHNFICEQMIRYEFGLPKRDGHLLPLFTPINPNNPNDNPKIEGRLADAAMHGVEDEVYKLLTLGADVQEAVHGAVKAGNIKLLKDLVKNHNANLSIPTKAGIQQNTAAHVAAFCGQHKIIQYLDELGVDLSLPNKVNVTPLHFACMSKQHEVIRYLVKKQVPVNHLAQHSPLDYLLSLCGSKRSLKTLLDAGAKLSEDYEETLSSSYDSLEPRLREKFEFVRSYFAQKGDFGVIENENPRPKRKNEILPEEELMPERKKKS